MSLFYLNWLICRDGYRIADQVSTNDHKRPIEMGGLADLLIVSNSTNRQQTEPLKIPGLYRILSKCDPSAEGVLNFVNVYGFLLGRSAQQEAVALVIEQIFEMRRLVEAIDRRDWKLIADGLSRAGQENVPSGGIGRLGILFDISADQPKLNLRPASLADALQVQALLDVSLGVEHQKCKNPECDQYFPLSGPEAYRSDAKYHSPACQRRHTYLKRRESKK